MNLDFDKYVKSLTVYECKNKYRLGNFKDGGYVLMDIGGYDLMLSGGVGGDIEFEKAFTEKYKVKCYAFDGTETSGFKLTKDLPLVTYINKNVGPHNTNNTSNFDFGFENGNNIFMKLDIEGAEYDLLNSFTDKQMNTIRQLVIEFHWPDTRQKWNALLKITKTHYLIHYHANNNNHIIYNINHNHIPAVFECTYIRKDLLDNPGLNKEPFPTKLDARNTYVKMDFVIDCPPWVHK